MCSFLQTESCFFNGQVIEHDATTATTKNGCVEGFPEIDSCCLGVLDGEPTAYKKGNHEDVVVGVCLKTWGVLPHDTRDKLGRHFFSSLSPTSNYIEYTEKNHWWYVDYSYKQYEHENCCAPHMVLFHGVSDAEFSILNSL